MSDITFMKRALELARANLGCTSPNPSVGAVLVQDGVLVSEGTTQPQGHHAEIEALTKQGDTLYVTLEPCCHTNKKTPPCTDAIIAAGVQRVVIATQDKNPAVNGNGIQTLQGAGITVDCGVLQDEAETLYASFFKWITTGLPFVTVKAAITQNGSMTWGNEKRKWITGAEATRHGHVARKCHDAILIGVTTVINDDPQLTTRLVDGTNPLKVVLDTHNRIPKDAKLYNEGDVLVFSKDTTPLHEGKLDLKHVLQELGRRNITSLMVEGGPTVIASFLNQGLADKLSIYVGTATEQGRGFFGLLTQQLVLSTMCIEQFGDDVLVEGHLQ